MIVQTNKNFKLGPAMIINLTQGKVAFVSPSRFVEVSKFKWCAKKSNFKWYAIRRKHPGSKKAFVSMHREIAQTPDDQLCHHGNSNSLDNRDLNLENMPEFDHIKRHSWR